MMLLPPLNIMHLIINNFYTPYKSIAIIHEIVINLVNLSLSKMKTQKLYLLFLILLIIVPLSIKGVNAFSKERAIAVKMINDDKVFAGEIEEMKITLELLRKNIETRQNKRYVESISHNSDKPQTIYTIQIGSYINFASAQNKFNSIMEVLTKKYCSFLRVEKVGTFYTVRLGKFESYRDAENFIKSVSPNILNVKILKAFLKYERLRSCICY